MPPLGLHMALGKRVALTLKGMEVEEEGGSYYLGTTAPDIRIMTRQDRRETHFYDLATFDEQSGVRGLLEASPTLREPQTLNAATRAFISGYMTHLVMDETWIGEVYRPFFGVHSPLRGSVEADIMDRVLQYELERRGRADQALMEEIRGRLSDELRDVQVAFLDRETLERWRQVNLDVVQRPPDWQRFRFIASHHLRRAGVEGEKAVESLMGQIPELLERVRRHVSEERVEEFFAEALRRSVQALKEYLGCE